MTELDVAPPTADDLSGPPRPTWSSAVAAVAAVLVLVAGVAAVAWWRSTPPELMPVGVLGLRGPATVGHTYYTDAVLDVRPDADPASTLRHLRIDRITPRVSENSAKALVSLLVCSRTPETHGLGLGEYDSLAGSCDAVRPFTGQQEIDLGFQTAQVVVAVTPTQPGTVHVEGFEVTYASTGRSVTTASGLDLVLTARP
jgi:hypothetical protein